MHVVELSAKCKRNKLDISIVTRIDIMLNKKCWKQNMIYNTTPFLQIKNTHTQKTTLIFYKIKEVSSYIYLIHLLGTFRVQE